MRIVPLPGHFAKLLVRSAGSDVSSQLLEKKSAGPLIHETQIAHLPTTILHESFAFCLESGRFPIFSTSRFRFCQFRSVLKLKISLCLLQECRPEIPTAPPTRSAQKRLVLGCGVRPESFSSSYQATPQPNPLRPSLSAVEWKMLLSGRRRKEKKKGGVFALVRIHVRDELRRDTGWLKSEEAQRRKMGATPRASTCVRTCTPRAREIFLWFLFFLSFFAFVLILHGSRVACAAPSSGVA